MPRSASPKVSRFASAAVFSATLFLAALPAGAENSATTPVPRDGGPMQRHESINKNVLARPDSQLLFIGDSITQGWEGPGRKAWAESFADYQPLNLGIGGDRTQHVLWRLENGNLSGLKPRVAVIMIGTNNTGGDTNTPAEIAEGVAAIVSKLRGDLPGTRLLLLAIFPRGENPDHPQRKKVAEVNGILEQLDDGDHVRYLDIGAEFLSPDKTISKEIMPDFLHLSPKGYEIWAAAVLPKIKELMK